jgi:hypothetical protein
MKLLLFLLLPLGALAQQDFDYALYTRHELIPGIVAVDSFPIDMHVERRIVKDGAHLQIIPCSNTGEALEYRIDFQGFHFGKLSDSIQNIFGGTETMSLEYLSGDQKYRISIWPMIPLVEIHDVLSGKLYDRYY